MKSVKAFLMFFALTQVVSAGGFPQLYCVSTKGFQNVNQINVFTNAKGTMHISLQFYATDGQEEGNFDSANLQTITRLQYDPSTGVITNGVGKVELQVDANSITPAQADKIMTEGRGNRLFDLENPSGHRVLFSKFYRATMTRYNLPGRRNYWDGSLMAAFKAGVNEYICGDVLDAKGAAPSFFDFLNKE